MVGHDVLLTWVSAKKQKENGDTRTVFSSFFPPTLRKYEILPTKG